jgi:hypothetical protein
MPKKVLRDRVMVVAIADAGQAAAPEPSKVMADAHAKGLQSDFPARLSSRFI